MPDDTAQRLRDFIRESLSSFPGLLSVTPVGSVFDGADPARAADIDIVAVFEPLPKSTFDEAVSRFSQAVPEKLGLGPRRVQVNPTFGPQKFDSGDTVVFHLMMYDLAGHVDHVEKSPFTCLDWERYLPVQGHSLAELYPVLRLFPADFKSLRRGVADYLLDIAAGSLSVRKNEWRDGRLFQTVNRIALNAAQSGQFAFHIISNSLANAAKMVLGDNKRRDNEELTRFCGEWLPTASRHIPSFEMIRRAKLDGTPFPPGALKTAGEFADDMVFDIENIESAMHSELVLTRHFATRLNDGTFLGQGRDPEVLPDAKVEAGNFDFVYTSPAKRARMSCALVAPGLDATGDARLLEQNYGSAEGMSFDELCARHPDVVEAWKNGEDPSFPLGESQKEVFDRAMGFLREKAASPRPGRALVMTHNVVLRCIVGSLMQVPTQKWHRIRVRHGEAFVVKVAGDRFIPVFTPAQRLRIREDVK